METGDYPRFYEPKLDLGASTRRGKHKTLKKSIENLPSIPWSKTFKHQQKIYLPYDGPWCLQICTGFTIHIVVYDVYNLKQSLPSILRSKLFKHQHRLYPPNHVVYKSKQASASILQSKLLHSNIGFSFHIAVWAICTPTYVWPSLSRSMFTNQHRRYHP